MFVCVWGCGGGGGGGIGAKETVYVSPLAQMMFPFFFLITSSSNFWVGETGSTEMGMFIDKIWSTVSPVFFGRYPRSSLHSFVLFPPPPLSPSLISHLASVDVKQHGHDKIYHSETGSRTHMEELKKDLLGSRIVRVLGCPSAGPCWAVRVLGCPSAGLYWAVRVLGYTGLSECWAILGCPSAGPCWAVRVLGCLSAGLPECWAILGCPSAGPY